MTVGSSPSSAKIFPHMAEVVVLPLVPQTAMVFLPVDNSPKNSA